MGCITELWVRAGNKGMILYLYVESYLLQFAVGLISLRSGAQPDYAFDCRFCRCGVLKP